jgi:hypothetical protein
MIVGKFAVPNIGECALERVKLTPNPHGALAFELSSAGRDVGFFSLGQVYDEAGRPTSDRELVRLDVDEYFRGRRAATFLTAQAVEVARKMGAANLVTYAVNERTVSAVASNVDVASTTFKLTDKKGNIPPDAGPISMEQALDFLRQERLRQFPEDPESSEILANGEAVYIHAPIA